MSLLVYDIEVAFYPEITKMAIERGVDERKFSWAIDANLRYVTHISYKIDNQPAKDLSLLDYKGSLVGPVNEKELLKAFTEIYNQCDESAAHYGSKFDIRFLNSRIALYGLPRLKPVKLHDTWRILKDKFLLSNNRLDTAIKFFHCPFEKPSLEWDVWRKVSLGDMKAHKLLRHRCHYDVLSLHWLIENKLKVFFGRVINRALPNEKPFVADSKVTKELQDAGCPECGEIGTLVRKGYLPTQGGWKFQLRCKGCYQWMYARVTAKGTMGPIR